MNFGLGAALEKQISWRVKGTLSGLRWSGGVLSGRSHETGTAGNPARFLPGRPPGSALSEPSRTVADARKRGVPPSANQRHADLEDSFSYPCPSPAQCCPVAPGSAWSLHSWSWSSSTSRRLGKRDPIRGWKIQAHQAPPVKPSGVVLSSVSSPLLRQVLHSSPAEPHCGSMGVLGIGGANEEGSEGAGTMGAGTFLAARQGPRRCNCPEVRVNSKNFVEKLKPVDLSSSGKIFFFFTLKKRGWPSRLLEPQRTRRNRFFFSMTVHPTGARR